MWLILWGLFIVLLVSYMRLWFRHLKVSSIIRVLDELNDDKYSDIESFYTYVEFLKKGLLAYISFVWRVPAGGDLQKLKDCGEKLLKLLSKQNADNWRINQYADAFIALARKVFRR